MIEWILLGALLASLYVSLVLYKKLRELERVLAGMRVKRGMNVEQLLPLSSEYPYNPRGFRFIGDPIDGIQFNDDSIVVIEFKSGASRMSGRQRRIRELVEEGKVRFEVYRVE